MDLISTAGGQLVHASSQSKCLIAKWLVPAVVLWVRKNGAKPIAFLLQGLPDGTWDRTLRVTRPQKDSRVLCFRRQIQPEIVTVFMVLNVPLGLKIKKEQIVCKEGH